MRGLFLFVALFVSALILNACEAPPSTIANIANYAPNVETARLENGMEIIVIPDARAPVVTHMVWYRVGSIDEPQGKSGIAHFFEHLMFRGTKGDPEGLFSKNVARAGGRDNAFTSYDFTAYFQRIASDKLEQMMAQEADRMRNLIINAERVLIERDVILEERALRVDSDPSAVLNEQLYAALFADSAYGVPVIGKRAEIAALTAADAKKFYETHYRPANAVLVVAGDVTLENVVALAQNTYGKIENVPASLDDVSLGGAPYPIIADAYPRAGDITLADERTTQRIWRRIYRLPPLLHNTKDTAAFDMLAEILAGGYNTPLHQKLVVEDAQATQVFVGADAVRRGNGLFFIQVNLTPDADFDTITTSIETELARIRSGDIDADELETVRFRLLADAIYARDSQHTLAYIYGQAGALGLRPDDVAQWFVAIEEMTPQDIIDIAEKWLGSDNGNNYVQGYLTPASRGGY